MVSIAIDGPAGAGKSTIAKAVAKELGYIYVDTGAMYRAIALFALRAGLDLTDEAALAPRLTEIALVLHYEGGVQKIDLNGVDVSEDIRTTEVSRAVSRVAALPAVRAFLFEQQREMARRYDVIMDGRDIGTVVLPDADVKIFLTASPQARAKRRYDEYAAKGQDVRFEDILYDMERRDYEDAHRSAAPLRQAEDAVCLDTTDVDLPGAIALVLQTIKKRGIQ